MPHAIEVAAPQHLQRLVHAISHTFEDMKRAEGALVRSLAKFPRQALNEGGQDLWKVSARSAGAKLRRRLAHEAGLRAVAEALELRREG